MLDEQQLHYTQSGEDVKFFFGIFPDDLRQVDGDEIDQPLLDQRRLLVCVVEQLPTENGVLSVAILLTSSRRRQGSLVQAIRADISFSWRNFFSFPVLPHATLSSAKGEGSVGARIVCRSSEQTFRLGIGKTTPTRSCQPEKDYGRARATPFRKVNSSAP